MVEACADSATAIITVATLGAALFLAGCDDRLGDGVRAIDALQAPKVLHEARALSVHNGLETGGI